MAGFGPFDVTVAHDCIRVYSCKLGTYPDCVVPMDRLAGCACFASSVPPPGGAVQSQVVGGHVTEVDLETLDRGAQYEVQVVALVQNREGSPVSIRVTTREFHSHYMCTTICPLVT